MNDLVIHGGVVHDGLGSPSLHADVAVDAGRVVAIGRDVGPGRRAIDAEGRFVTPGFGDAHSHSDALPLMDEPQPQHPRTWGCFPEFFGRYVRERGIVAWEEAIRKATSATALQFDLAHRGTLLQGSIADICVFDPETIAHPGSYTEPSVTPVGIDHVLLAGSVVVESGGFTGARAGRVLRA